MKNDEWKIFHFSFHIFHFSFNTCEERSPASCPLITMSIEIEKKYRLTKKQQEEVLQRLPRIGAKLRGEDFEVNTIYTGETLDLERSILRLRRVGNRGILAYKERFPSSSAIKRQREDETGLDDPNAMELILDALGFTPALVYEKRRETWRLGKTEIVVDELPFGLFMEIEGPENDIQDVESKLAIKRLRTETATYPQLTLKHGIDYGGVVESRFPEPRKEKAARPPGSKAAS